MKRQVPRLEGEARQVARGEFIGRAVRVSKSADARIVGLEGTVVDETLRTLVVRLASGREVRLGKVGTEWEFGRARIPGSAIEYRPAERTKKVR